MDRARIIRLILLLCLLLSVAACFFVLFSSGDGTLSAILRSTHRVGEKPTKFGALHLSFLALSAALAVTAAILGRRTSREALDRGVFLFGMLFLLLEAYKQAYYHVILGEGVYQISVLPLQLCSYVLYLSLLLPIQREGRVKDTLYCFTALFETAGGAVVIVYPLFYRELALSVHTLLWHTAMIAVGVWILAARGYGRRYLSEVFSSFLVFLALFLTGLTLNVLLPPDATGGTKPLNLFYLSPHGETNMFLIGFVREHLGLAAAATVYALLILLGASAVWVVGHLIRLISTHRHPKGGE